MIQVDKLLPNHWMLFFQSENFIIKSNGHTNPADSFLNAIKPRLQSPDIFRMASLPLVLSQHF